MINVLPSPISNGLWFSMVWHGMGRYRIYAIGWMRVHYRLHYDIFTKQIITRNIEYDTQTHSYAYTWRTRPGWLFSFSLALSLCDCAYVVRCTYTIDLNFYGFHSFFGTHSLSLRYFCCSFAFA